MGYIVRYTQVEQREDSFDSWEDAVKTAIGASEKGYQDVTVIMDGSDAAATISLWVTKGG